MVCDTKLKKQQTPAQRLAEVTAAAKALQQKLLQGTVTVTIGRTTGALALQGWTEEERAGISDACIYRLLAQTWEMRQAVARAEALAGRKLDQQAVLSGVHSHDGGVTWSKH